MKSLFTTVRRFFAGNRNNAPTSAVQPTKPSAHKPAAKPRSSTKGLRFHLSVVPRSLGGGQPVFMPKSTHQPRHLRRKTNRRNAARKARNRRLHKS